MKKKLFDFIISHKILVSAMLLGITVFSGRFAARVQFDNTVETYFLEDDLKDYNRLSQ